MRLLMLGGTEFVGRAVTEAALARGWEVTVFHRGHHAAPAGTRAVHGDRTAEGGLDGLADGEWDVVVDTWSAAPRVVRDAARLLAGRAGRYVYVSSASVYRYPGEAGSDENFPVVDGDPDADASAYAEDKRGGELAAIAGFGAERTLLARAGLILGPWENIGRLPWWLNRMERGGTVLAPGPRDLDIQYVDVRDLAEWILDAAAAGLHGPYNLVSPMGRITMGELLDACAEVTESTATLRWTEPQAVLDAGIEQWMELPVWLAPGELHDTMHRTSSEKAIATGLRTRPAAETVRDTWEWLRSIGGTAPQRPDRPVVGLAPEKEAKALGL
ncbi:NAD-dependent epimerase/dehydratase family protein [Streptomyces sp. KL118A]|uniref:NAD-dependent epimerase/dehydratase family protein n=1 Tax=Streptomyces sp. KL118A TaxID=3045153 RepID=UPI00278C3B8F|nr:NAD-dependent epimerase/dehydratase family protein [Streptomyces sp. KL118A]